MATAKEYAEAAWSTTDPNVVKARNAALAAVLDTPVTGPIADTPQTLPASRWMTGTNANSANTWKMEIQGRDHKLEAGRWMTGTNENTADTLELVEALTVEVAELKAMVGLLLPPS